MSPVSRKRARKTRQRQNPSVDRLSAEIVSGYRELLDAAPLDAELATAELYGTWWLRSLVDGGDPDAPLAGVLEYAARHRGRDALAAVTAAAYLADGADTRQAAAEAAGSLRAAGVAPPVWADRIGGTTPGRCLLARDVYGEETTVACELRRHDEREVLYAVLDNDLDGSVSEAWLGSDPDAVFAELTEQAADPDGLLTTTEVEPSEAAHAIRSGFAVLAEIGDVPDDEKFAEGRALVLARLRDLPGDEVTEAPPVPPEPDDDELDGVVTDFLASPQAADLPPGAPTRKVCELIVDYGPDLRIGPRRLDDFLHSGAAANLDEPAREVFPAVVVAWTRYAAARAGLPDAAVRPLVEQAVECAEHGTEGAAPDVDRLLSRYVPELDTLPSDELPDADELADTLARRLFAVPDLPDEALDPADPDDRRAAIEAEHPEYQDALDTDALDTGATVDDVDPRLHIAMHEVVANQLWDNTPPQVWQAARRLLDGGADRTEILHTLAEVAARPVTGTINGGGYDPAKHIADLDAL